IGCRFLKSVSAKQLGFFSSAAFSAAEKRDYDQHFAARQLLFFSAAINTLRRSLLSQTNQRPTTQALDSSNLASSFVPRFR
ncbi:hypothetical protein, partial [Burkholderia gladioli]|uniref:hypothetical protein n=1 Tax=Burkholderia gladioli TaxID=28095 RepID=UPI001ABB682B